MAEAGFAGVKSGLSSINNKDDSPPPDKKETDSSDGLFTLWEPPESTVPELDIVFIHGLQGDATGTWATSKLCWPKDLLPNDLPAARIMTFEYNTLVLNEPPPQIRDLANVLLDSLTINRRLSRAGSRPLIFIAHSLGGLIVKQAYLRSRALGSVDEDYFLVSVATKACIFFGTPHIKTSKASWTQIRWQILKAVAVQAPSLERFPRRMLMSVEAEDILKLSADFCFHSSQTKLISIYETLMTSTNRGKLLVVPRESVVMGVPNETCVALDADHVHMTKFDDSTNEVYQLIVGLMRETRETEPKKLVENGLAKDGEHLTVDPKVDSASLEESTDLVELERRFLADLKSDWLDDVSIEDHTEGTCEWILDSQEIDSWLRPSGSEPMFWIRGAPGVGKTVLAKYVYRQLSGLVLGDASPPITKKFQCASAICKNQPGSFQVLAYFLGSGNPMRNKGLSMLQSLLYQVLSTNQNLFQYVYNKQLFRQPQRGDFGQYMSLLRTVLQDASLSGTVIVLDALDECEEVSRSLLIQHLVAIASQSRVKVLVTSQSQSAVKIEPSIKMHLDHSNENVDRDINQYLRTATKDLARKRKLSAQLETEVTSKLSKSRQKSFLWIQLALQSITKATTTVSVLRNKLECLPSSLSGFYSEMISQSHGFIAIALRRTLYFVMVTKGPLQIQELSALLAISQSWDSRDRGSQASELKKQCIEIAKNLRIEDVLENKPINLEEDFMPYFRPLLNMNERYISLVHFTLPEFLQRPSAIAYFQATFGVLWPECSPRSSNMPEVHAIMAILCLQYMFAAFRDRSDPLQFQDFAAIHWIEHARKAGERQNEVLKALIKTLFRTTEFFSAWLDVLRSSGQAQDLVLPSTSDFALILAAVDLGSLYGDTLGISMDSLASKDINDRTPLHFAAANNAISSVYWIKAICTGGEMSFDDISTQTDTDFQTPLHLAAQRGHKEVVELLLDEMNSEFLFDGKAFEKLANNGHKELFGTLYSKTKIQDPNQLIHLLNQAAKLDSVELVKNISFDFHSRVDRGLASLADLADNRISLFHAALGMQSNTVIESLLDKEDLCKAVDRNGWTALHAATDKGNVPIASQLIEKGIWLNARDSQGDAALHIASRNGFPELVRLLCEKGAMVNLMNDLRQFPAFLAVEAGDKEILQILCDYGTKLDTMDYQDRTMLHVASKAGQEAIVNMLVDAGVCVNANSRRWRRPAHCAVESGNLRIFYKLLIAGAHPMVSDFDQICPIHVAAEQGSEVFTRVLLKELGVNPNCRDSQGRTPLHHSCSSKNSTTIAATILLESGAKVRASDSKGVHPIHLAAERGSESLVKLLISHGADLDCSDTEGRNPLHYSCSAERPTTAVVKLLIHNGTYVNRRDRDMNTPLYYAEQNNKRPVIKLLRDAGACL